MINFNEKSKDSSIDDPITKDNDGTIGINVINGTSKNDFLLGTSENDLISGEAGHDFLKGLEGDDALFGGSGSDVLFGDEGDDTLYGESGNDLLFGGSGNNNLYGGLGGDTYVIEQEFIKLPFNDENASGSDQIDKPIFTGNFNTIEDEGGSDDYLDLTDYSIKDLNSSSALDTNFDGFTDSLYLSFSDGNSLLVQNYYAEADAVIPMAKGGESFLSAGQGFIETIEFSDAIIDSVFLPGGTISSIA